ncbi:MAG: hypothetical protein Q7S01_01365 [bacterium]|nr:hypothetical protein [bacterium]
MSLSFAHKRERVIAVADIASDSAGACIALVRDDAPASIICAERSSLTYDEKSPEQAITSILSLLEDASAKVMRIYSKLPNADKRPISSVHAIIHTPLVTSQTERADTSFKTEELITHNVIGNLARTALTGQKDLDKARLFEAGVASIELNGYRTGRPVGRRAHNVSVAALISQCEPELRAKIVDTLRKGFGVQNPVLHSDTRAILLGTHANSIRTNIHFTIDVSGYSTNCVVIHKDAAAEHLVVPEGVRTILKRIAGKGLAEEKLSLMKMVSRDSCTTTACEELNATLARVEPELVKIFGEAFSKLISERRMPNDLVLIVAPDFAPWMSNFFSRIDFGQFTVTARQFSVHALTPEAMRDSVSGNLGPKVDAWLSLGTALASADEKST